jgi:chromosome partitioning protein
MKPSKTLFINQKGGVGKTTLLREIGFYLSSVNKKVLFIDCDPQGNLTKSLIEEVGCGLYDALEDDIICITPVRDNLFILTADTRLSAYSKRITGDLDAYNKIPELLKDEKFNKFDFIFLDIPPGLGALTVNGLVATENIIIPMSPSMYSMHGANDLIETIDKAKKQLNPNLNILGVVINCFDKRPVIMNQISDEIKTGFGSTVFNTPLSRSIKIEEVIATRTGLIELDGTHKIKDEIKKIGLEYLRRIEALNG